MTIISDKRNHEFFLKKECKWINGRVWREKMNGRNVLIKIVISKIIKNTFS